MSSGMVSAEPTEGSGSKAMFATEQRWSRVVAANEKRRISTSRERAEIRDVLTEKNIAHEKTHWKRYKNGVHQRIGKQDVSGRPFFLCSQLRMREQWAVQKT